MRNLNLYLFFLLVLTISFAQEITTCSHLKTSRAFFDNPPTLSRNQADFDVKYYDIDLQLFPSTENVSGTLGILVESQVDGMDEITLDFISGMNVTAVADLSGNPLSYNHQNNNLLVIDLPESISAGELYQAVISYDGQPQATGFGSFGFDSYAGEDMIWTLSEPYGARDWWPCKDTPTDKADSVDISIKVPDDLIVASNGLLVDTEVQGDWTTYHWEERYPIATYLVSLAVYPYTVFYDWYVYSATDSMRLDYYVYPNHFNTVQENYALTDDMLHGFGDRFGLYPFIDEKYGHAEFVWGGGMEHQTMTSMGGWSQHLISHELAHSWWGNMVTCANFHHIWLNEGLATYGQAMWYEIRDNSIQSLHDEMWNKRYLGGGTIYVSDTTSVGQIFSGNLSYNKASWVFHMMRHMFGDELFFQALQEYGDEFRFSSATTDGLKNVFEDVTGRDLDHFIDRWIYGEYYPSYSSENSYWTNCEGRSLVKVVISQNQQSPPFWMPVDIKINTTSGPITVVAENTEPNQEFYFPVEGTPTQVQLDPDNWILRTVQNGLLEDNGCLAAGDLNQDGVIDVLDIVTIVNLILNPVQADPVLIWVADLNSDGNADVLDIVLTINIILGN